MGPANNLSQYDFHRKKCLIHLVELDELNPKIGVQGLKTHAKSDNNAERSIHVTCRFQNLSTTFCDFSCALQRQQAVLRS